VIPAELPLWVAVGVMVFASVARWEHARPARRQQVTRSERRPTNIAMALLSSRRLRLVLPVTAIGTAAFPNA
jgi:hypothetical protein